jgi:hypothetical protein
MPKYQDFVLTVNGKEGEYTVEARGGAGLQVDPVACSFTAAPEIRAYFERIEMGYPPSPEIMKQLGGWLYNGLFPRKIAESLKSMEGKLTQGSNLRLKLNIRPPELRDLPWEFLFDPEDERFLANQLSSPVVRFIAADQPVDSTVVSSPLKILTSNQTRWIPRHWICWTASRPCGKPGESAPKLSSCLKPPFRSCKMLCTSLFISSIMMVMQVLIVGKTRVFW